MAPIAKAINKGILARLCDTADRNIEVLLTFITLPSMASQRGGVREYALWFADTMSGTGILPVIACLADFSVIMGEVAGRSERSMLVHCQYDV